MNKKVGIIGFGNIGKRLYKKLCKTGWNVAFYTTSKFIFTDKSDTIENWQKYCKGVDIVFLAIPTLDDGLIASNYIKNLISRKIRVVTCEKGALGNYFYDLKSLLPCIGYSATVGGGSGIIHFLKQRFFSGIQEIHAILNGTVNYTFCDLAIGNPVGRITEETQKLGYADPGAGKSVEIIYNEVGFDATKKVSILFNLCFGSNIILRAKDIEVILDEEKIRTAVREAISRRFVVSFYRRENFTQEPSDITAFVHNIDNWVIKGAFVRMDNPLIARLCNATLWVNNGILTVEGEEGIDGVYLCVGDGAGASPTTAAMIRDAESF